jgi:hypothetical protein
LEFSILGVCFVVVFSVCCRTANFAEVRCALSAKDPSASFLLAWRFLRPLGRRPAEAEQSRDDGTGERR